MQNATQNHIIKLNILPVHKISSTIYKIFCHQFNLFFPPGYLLYHDKSFICFNWPHLRTIILASKKVIINSKNSNILTLIENIFKYFINNQCNLKDYLFYKNRFASENLVFQYRLNTYDKIITYTVFVINIITETILVSDIGKYILEHFANQCLEKKLYMIYI